MVPVVDGAQSGADRDVGPVPGNRQGGVEGLDRILAATPCLWRPIGKFQILQHYMADMAIAIENARNLIYKSAFLCQKGLPYHMEASMAKIVAGYASEIAAIKGMEIFGGYGYAMEYDMQRHFSDYKQMIFSPDLRRDGQEYDRPVHGAAQILLKPGGACDE